MAATEISIAEAPAWEIGAVLRREFYARPVLEVARACIGAVVVRETQNGTLAGRIVEAEAYRGPQDRAAHSWRGRRTPRTEVMFAEPGLAYVFFVYGMHWHLNLVANAPGKPEAVLIRALEPVLGRAEMAKHRKLPVDSRQLCNGPGKICQALAIGREFYGHDLTLGEHLYLAEGSPAKVERSPRIGIDYAGAWALKPWRFSEVGNPNVSRSAARRKDSQ